MLPILIGFSGQEDVKVNEKKNEIIKVQFLNREIAARSIEGDLWFTAREVAEMLEVEGGHRVVLNLFNDHKAEFLESESSVMQIMTGAGVRRSARLFSAKAVDLLAVLARSPRGVEVRRWCVDLRERLRSGASAEITREQFDALKSERDLLVADRNEWRARALDGEMRIGRMEGRFEGLCVLLESRVSRDAGNVSDAKKHPDLMAIGRDKRRRDALEKAGRGRDAFLFEGMEGPDAFEALRARCFEVVTAEVKKNAAELRATPYRRHAFARLVKNCSHRQAIAAVESLVADGSIDVRGGKVSVATEMTTARKSVLAPVGGVA